MMETMKLIKVNFSHGVTGQKEIRRIERRTAKNLFTLNGRVTAYVNSTARALMDAVSKELHVNAFRNLLRELSTHIVALGNDFTVFGQLIAYYQHLYKHRSAAIDGAPYETTLVSLDEILPWRLRA